MKRTTTKAVLLLSLALITARIDEALADGDIDADEAADLKAELDDADLPGYKPSPFRGGGDFGGAHHGRGR